MRALNCKKTGVEWPESNDPVQAAKVVRALVARLRDGCGIDLKSAGTRLILAPDPPKSARPLSWVLEQLDGATDEDIHGIDWGKRGRACVVAAPALFAEAMTIFLSMKSTTLTILAVASRSDQALTDAEAARLIEFFLNDRAIAEGYEFGALLFDMGVLRDCVCYRACC